LIEALLVFVGFTTAEPKIFGWALTKYVVLIGGFLLLPTFLAYVIIQEVHNV
jgi:hypothetical protein